MKTALSSSGSCKDDVPFVIVSKGNAGRLGRKNIHVDVILVLQGVACGGLAKDSKESDSA